MENPSTSGCPYAPGTSAALAPGSEPVRRIAIAGKGGSGKTTISGTLARIIARRGRTVWAIDADSTPNLGLTLGLPREELGGLQPLPRTLLVEGTDAEGKRKLALGHPPSEVVRAHGRLTPDGIPLLLMGSVGHAGAG
ncbi:MAG: AAA family ATPase [Thermoanaerobaculia bacterium]